MRVCCSQLFPARGTGVDRNKSSERQIVLLFTDNRLQSPFSSRYWDCRSLVFLCFLVTRRDFVQRSVFLFYAWSQQLPVSFFTRFTDAVQCVGAVCPLHVKYTRNFSPLVLFFFGD